MPAWSIPSRLFAMLAFMAQDAQPPAASEPRHPPPAAAIQTTLPFPLPEWARDASWYYIDVPRFSNGSKDNDPPGTRPWNEPLNPPDAKREDLFTTSQIPYGGDLQGVRARLKYVKDLGFSAVCLGRVFADDPEWAVPLGQTWHVDPAISLAGPRGWGAVDPQDSTWPPGDRLLLDLVKDAHALQLKVIVEVPIVLRADSRDAPHVLPKNWRPPLGPSTPQMARWLKPSPGGADVEGLDGFAISFDESCPEELMRSWLEGVRQANPNAAILASCFDPGENCPVGSFPLVATSQLHPGPLIASRAALSYSSWLRHVESLLAGGRAVASRVVVHGFSSYLTGRFAGLVQRAESDLERELDDPKARRLHSLRVWRLTLAVTMCLPNSIMLMYGDEVGMTGVHGPDSLAPMWWVEPGSRQAPTPGYRADFRSLVRLMNRVRAVHEPLRRGNFTVVLADDARRVFAFARTAGQRQVIVVVNASTQKQEIELAAGVPGGLLGVIRPELEPVLPRSQQAAVDPTQPVFAEPHLRYAGNRAIVDAEGMVRINLDPMSLKLVLVGGDIGE